MSATGIVITTIMSVVLLIICIVLCIFLFDLIRAWLVPFVKTRKTIKDLLLKNLKLKKDDVFIELGCGDAEIISAVSNKFNNIKARGYEIALAPYLRAFYRKRNDKNRYEIIKKSFMSADLSDADVLYCYLMPYFMKPLWKKLTNNCKPGTLLYSFAFSIPDVKPMDVYKIPNEKKKYNKFDELFVYKV